MPTIFDYFFTFRDISNIVLVSVEDGTENTKIILPENFMKENQEAKTWEKTLKDTGYICTLIYFSNCVWFKE